MTTTTLAAQSVLATVIDTIKEYTGVLVGATDDLYEKVRDFDYLDTLYIFTQVREKIKVQVDLHFEEEHQIKTAADLAAKFAEGA